jgi:hypothetical protein
MRSHPAAVVTTLGLSLAALVVPAAMHADTASATTTAAPTAATTNTIAPISAVASDSVVDSYGVGIHLAYLDTPYKDATAVASALHDLRVRHVRDDLYLNNPRQYAGMATVAQQGIKFDLITGRPTEGANAADYVHTVATQVPAGSVESLEGTNEWDLSARPDWVTELLTRQQQLYTAAKAEPATANLPVLAPALAFRWNYAALGTSALGTYSDLANAHMYPGGYKPSNEVGNITTALRTVTPTQPLVVTEAGYHNAINTTNGHLPVPEDVSGVYLPRLMLEHYLHGDMRTYSYELIDEFDDPGLTNPEAHFGLLSHDLSPKPAYTAMKTLLGLLSDPGPSFRPSSLPVSVTGAPSDTRQLLTQKRDGSYVLLLWRDASVYDPVTHTSQPVQPSNVTVNLASRASFDVYRPSTSPDVLSHSSASTSLPLQLDGQVTAVTIKPATAPGRPTISSTAVGKQSITVSWSKPSDDGGSPVTGYKLVSGTKTLTVGATTTRATITGLTAGRRARVSVQAKNAIGLGAAAYSPYVTPKR